MSNQSTITVKKPVGKTPLEMIELLRKKIPSLEEERLGYAGRLDPMADGLLLILAGTANNERKQLERLPKKYLCQALFGLETDSYDILGLFTQPFSDKTCSKEVLEKILKSYVGKQIQPYPPYSSPRVNGHPLFWWAREGRLHEITIPEKEIDIYSIQLRSLKKIDLPELKKEVLKRLLTVSGTFRQEEIIEQWNFFFQNHTRPVIAAELEVSCSSGTYIRSLIQKIGKNVGSGALALSITRTSIGSYSLKDAISLD